MTNVQRHPTIPLTKRDSLVMNGSRVSLVSNGSNLNSTHLEDNDFVNTHANMSAGKPRTPRKEIKRTESYKKALNRESVGDELGDSFLTEKDVPKRESGIKASYLEDRKKYNTLPIRIDAASPSTNKTAKSKHQRNNGISSKTDLHRNASQKSGTYPSPDTDEDQRAIPPERKKKSTFKLVKERLILTFRREREDEKHKKPKIKKDKYASPNMTHRGRVKAGKDGGTKGLPSYELGNTTTDASRLEPDHSRLDHGLNGSDRRSGSHKEHKSDSIKEAGKIETLLDEKSSSNKDKKGDGHFNLFQSIRNSFRRKQAPLIQRRPKKQSFEEQGDSSKPPGSQTVQKQQAQSRDKNENDKTLLTSNKHNHYESDPVNIPPAKDKVPLEEKIELEEYMFEEDDSITELFGFIIDPSRSGPRGHPSGPGAHSSVSGRHSAVSGGYPSSVISSNGRRDRTQLKLEGLSTCRPNRVDTTIAPTPVPVGRHYYGQSDLSPTVEIDGLDYADAPTTEVPTFAEEDLECFDISQDERQRRIDDVAKRLAAIGDRIAADKESESSCSEVEGHRVGRRQSSFERDLMMDLRRFGDDFDKTLFGKDGVKCNISILPIVKNILASQDYSSFQRIVHQELSNTVGWETVAWYTYLIKTTVCLVGTGKEVGKIVTSRAKQYFKSSIKPWVVARPNGWESIYEETDVDTDVD